MEDWRTGFYEAVRQQLLGLNGYSKIKGGVSEILSVDQELPSPFYCETCGPDPIVVNIWYLDDKRAQHLYVWYGDLGEFISKL